MLFQVIWIQVSLSTEVRDDHLRLFIFRCSWAIHSLIGTLFEFLSSTPSKRSPTLTAPHSWDGNIFPTYIHIHTYIQYYRWSVPIVLLDSTLIQYIAILVVAHIHIYMHTYIHMNHLHSSIYNTFIFMYLSGCCCRSLPWWCYSGSSRTAYPENSYCWPETDRFHTATRFCIFDALSAISLPLSLTDM